MALIHHPDGGFYRYRRTPKPDKTALEAERIRTLIKANRQRLAFNASSSRPVSARLNQAIAQALRDGMKATRLAEATGLSKWSIRTIGLSFDDLLPSGRPPVDQLAAIKSLRAELAGLEESRAVLEERRLKLLAAARRLGVMDDFELAAASGLQSEAIRKLTWGLQPEVL